MAIRFNAIRVNGVNLGLLTVLTEKLLWELREAILELDMGYLISHNYDSLTLTNTHTHFYFDSVTNRVADLQHYGEIRKLFLSLGDHVKIDFGISVASVFMGLPKKINESPCNNGEINAKRELELINFALRDPNLISVDLVTTPNSIWNVPVEEQSDELHVTVENSKNLKYLRVDDENSITLTFDEPVTGRVLVFKHKVLDLGDEGPIQYNPLPKYDSEYSRGLNKIVAVQPRDEKYKIFFAKIESIEKEYSDVQG